MSEATAAEPATKPTVSTETAPRSLDIRSIRDAEEAKAHLTQLNRAHKALKAKYAELEGKYTKAQADHQKKVEELEATNTELAEIAAGYEEHVRDYGRKDAFREAAAKAGLKPERIEHALKQFDVEWGDTDKDGNFTGEVDLDSVTKALEGYKGKAEWSDWYAAAEASGETEEAPAVTEKPKPGKPEFPAKPPQPGAPNRGGTSFGLEAAKQIVTQLRGTPQQKQQAARLYTPKQIDEAYSLLEAQDSA